MKNNGTVLLSPIEAANYKKREDDFYFHRVQQAWKGRHIMHGRVPDKDSIILMSNDYLSLANHPEILKAHSDAILKTGNGLLMSSIFLHGNNPQANLESRLSAFLKSETSILCQSGWCANVGLMQTIADKHTPVYLDILAHMSIWEGVKSAGAKAYHFHHNNMAHLERQIKKHGSGIIAVDSLYSTSGSICPLTELVEVAERYDCILVVDESHSLGTHGDYGEGLVASLGLADRVHFRTASLAKAFAGRAGVITCSSRFRDYFRSTSLPAIFSSAILPHEIVALQKTLDIVIASQERRARLHALSKDVKQKLLDLGYNVGITQSQIIPLEAGPERETMKLRDALEKRDIFGAIFCAPATAKNRSMVRLSLHSELGKQEIAHLLEALADIRDEVRPDRWPAAKKVISI